MDRKTELLNYVAGDDENTRSYFAPLVDEVVFLESQLDALRKLPFLKIHPSNPELQKSTPAAKQYKELLQQYTNCLKVLNKTVNEDGAAEESPLRKWVRENVNPE